jgi:translation initiation factor 2B subunit (eIF-2B alpha/beta/delta family)
MTSITNDSRYKALKEIIGDKVHGSSQILTDIAENYLKNISDHQYLLAACKLIRKRLPHFAAIMNYVNNVESYIRMNQEKQLFTYLSNFNSKKENTYQKIFNNNFNLLKKHKRLLTISHSSTVLNVLKEWKIRFKSIQVFVCESRPDLEGLLMAEELRKLRVKTDVITEASTGRIISDVDLVILGADQILPNGDIINKTGSRMLAVLAKYHKIPVFVFATKDKLVKTDKTKSKSYIKNDNFEIVEKALITKILSG